MLLKYYGTFCLNIHQHQTSSIHFLIWCLDNKTLSQGHVWRYTNRLTINIPHSSKCRNTTSIGLSRIYFKGRSWFHRILQKISPRSSRIASYSSTTRPTVLFRSSKGVAQHRTPPQTKDLKSNLAYHCLPLHQGRPKKQSIFSGNESSNPLLGKVYVSLGKDNSILQTPQEKQTCVYKRYKTSWLEGE